MIEVTGDLWTFPAEFRIITTNGDVRTDGACVMGRGCALQAAKKYPKLPYELGTLIQKCGNHVAWLSGYDLFTFPVKRHWDEPASLNLIARSVSELQVIIKDLEGTYVLPRPGCGNGRLAWKDVRPLLLDLPDTVSVIDFPRAR